MSMSTSAEIIKKSSQSKNIITYIIVGLVFLVALWLSTQNEGPSLWDERKSAIAKISPTIVYVIILLE